MRKLPILLLVLCLSAACKKKEESNPVPDYKELTDFLYLPVRDAEWRVHMQGYVENSWEALYLCSDFHVRDTAAHQYYHIKSTGIDTYMSGFQYYRYDVHVRYDYTKPCHDIPDDNRFTFYLREDTSAKRIYAYSGYYENSLHESLIADFARDEIGDDADVAQQWPPTVVTNTNFAIIKGQKAKMWEVAYRNAPAIKFFYKGYGIGRQTGVLPKDLFVPGAEPRSVELIYKGESTKFEFELHP
jgi:hypothetical protein